MDFAAPGASVASGDFTAPGALSESVAAGNFTTPGIFAESVDIGNFTAPAPKDSGSHSHRQPLSAATSLPETTVTGSSAATFTDSREPEV